MGEQPVDLCWRDDPCAERPEEELTDRHGKCNKTVALWGLWRVLRGPAWGCQLAFG